MIVYNKNIMEALENILAKQEPEAFDLKNLKED